MRYTTYLGGLGTGIGEGNEGVKCARGRDCLGAAEVEVEVECERSSGDDGSEALLKNMPSKGSLGGGLNAEEKAGYSWREVEGLGGVVRKKVRKRERVGGCIGEWEDGEVEVVVDGRSWCGWCGRVVLKAEGAEEEDAKGEAERVVCRIEKRRAFGGI